MLLVEFSKVAYYSCLLIEILLHTAYIHQITITRIRVSWFILLSEYHEVVTQQETP